MSLHLIELQDHALSVRTPDAVLARSPGFANIAGGAPLFGDAARARARLHPREHFNQFWSQLNLDPLIVKNKFFRHAADLAHSHLAELTQALVMPEGAVIAAPSSYNRNQLAVLLGIVKQCSFAATGLVDLALLQAATTGSAECIIIDLQLHQAVLSRFATREGYLVKEQTIAVPFAGLVTLQEAWTGLITEEFITQSRFDPLHAAESDQYVHDRLEQWIAATLDNDKALLEINMKGVVHQALVTRAQLEQRAQPVYERIARELAGLRSANTDLIVRESQFHLPGLAQRLTGLRPLDDDAAMVACVQHFDYIRRPADRLQFITRLPLVGSAQSAPIGVTRQPSHVLFKHRALPLAAGKLLFGTPPADLTGARVLQLPFSGYVALVRTARGVQLEVHASTSVLCNGKPAQDGQILALGDTLQLPDTELRLIVVEQGA